MNETELERLVVRLTGDMSGYVKMLADAQTKSQETATKVEESMKKLAGAAATALAGLDIKSFLDGTLHSWDEQEKAIIQLNAVLKANGRDVEAVSEDYQEFSSQMQAVSTTGDEVVTSMLKQAESFGLTGAAAKQATKDAMALAAINGSSAEAMIRVTAAMAEGDIERAMMFSRMIPQLRGVRDETEFIARYQKLAASGMEAMRKESETASGRLKQLDNDWGDFKEQLGETLSKGIIPVATGLSDVSKWLQTLSPATRAGIITTGGLAASFVTVATVGPQAAAAVASVTAATKGLAVSMVAVPALGFTTAIAAAGVAVFAFREDIFSTKEAIDALNKSMQDLADREALLRQQRTNRFAAELLDIGKIGDKDERRRALEAQRDALKGQLDVLTSISNSMKQNRPNMLARWVGGPETDRFEQEFKELQKDLEDYRQGVLNVEAALQRLDRFEPGGIGLIGTVIQASFIMATEAIKQFKAEVSGGEYDSQLASDAEALIERLKTPLEKLMDQRIRLDEMLIKGKIGEDTYRRALEDLEKQLLATAEAHAALNREFNGAAFGTTEAENRIQAALLAMYGDRTKRHIDDNLPLGEARGIGGRGVMPMDGAGPGAARVHPWGPGATWVGVGEAKNPQGFRWEGVGEDKAVGVLEQILAELRGAPGIGVARVAGGS